jgi:uncharacterized protein YcbK (DUF882 family)
VAKVLLQITYVTLKLHSHRADFSMEWVNLNELMTIGKWHSGFTFREDSKGQGFWMRILSGRGFAVVAAAMVVVFGVSGSSWARTVKTRVHAGLKSSMHLKTPMRGEEVVTGVMPAEIAASGATTVVSEDGKPYQLKMTNLHTGESLDIVYRIGNTYLPEALEKLNYFLRDHNTQDVSNYDPKEFDVLHAMMARLGKLNGVIEIVCGYRTPETNATLRQNSPQTGVAEHSQHMEGHAIDLRVPGVPTARLRDAALSLQAGGVGYYPVSQFVHVDVGPVREWVFGSRQRRTILAQTRRVRSSHSSGNVAGQ